MPEFCSSMSMNRCCYPCKNVVRYYENHSFFHLQLNSLLYINICERQLSEVKEYKFCDFAARGLSCFVAVWPWGFFFFFLPFLVSVSSNKKIGVISFFLAVFPLDYRYEVPDSL